MNTREIMRAISAVKAKTIGVYAADHVPKILGPTPIAIVTNLDTSNKPGSAFISIATDEMLRNYKRAEIGRTYAPSVDRTFLRAERR